MAEESNFTEQCQIYLLDQWSKVYALAEAGEALASLGENHDRLQELIDSALKSSTKTYHYVLPTQLLCKSVDHTLDSHSVQVAYEKQGAFDARTVAHKVIVPFDQANHKVLGGSPEPYVNNPLRVPAVTKEYGHNQKQRGDWDGMVEVLDMIEDEDHIEFTRLLFDHVLNAIYTMLGDVIVVYPVPNRISIDQTSEILEHYLSTSSGGERLEAVSAALFRTIGERFHIYDRIEHKSVTAADQSTGMAADIECWSESEIVLLVEAKDRYLTLTQVDSKLDTARARQISEILFITQKGIDQSQTSAVDARRKSEFSSGQNVYVTDLADFSQGILMLFGEDGRVHFLKQVGAELESQNAGISHRREWAALLKEV